MINYLSNLISNYFKTPCRRIKRTHKVFIYDMMKIDEPEHPWLMDPKNGTAVFKGLGRTVKRYPLVMATKYHIPFLLQSRDNGCLVEGEVFEVDDDMLLSLDIVKDHPRFYEREEDDIDVKNKNTGPTKDDLNDELPPPPKPEY